VEHLARDELLSDLPFEFDAVGAVLGHGLHPLKARRSRSIPNLQAVDRQGRTPQRGHFQVTLDTAEPTQNLRQPGR
jgi:hypothetical protein